MDKCAIFIDGGYMQKVSTRSGIPVDYQRFSNLLADNCPILRTYYYTCMPYKSSKPTEDQNKRYSNAQRFVDTLKKLDRYEVRLGKLEHRGNNELGNPVFVQKRVDILLACDLVLLSSKSRISKAVLFTGDSDFVPAVEIAKSEGVEIVLCYYNADGFNPHKSLMQIADEREGIDDLTLKSIKYTPK